MDFVITTTYKGIKFRSRTEARWAAFFDKAGIKFRYEQEGFKLPGGIWYLPDFYFPEIKMFAEVKFDKFSNSEKEKCKLLCDITRKPVLMLDGPPDFKTYDLFFIRDQSICMIEDHPDHKHYLSICEEENHRNSDGIYFGPCDCPMVEVVYESNAILCTSDCKYYPLFYCPGFENKEGYFKPDDWYEFHAACIIAAQNEIFV